MHCGPSNQNAGWATLQRPPPRCVVREYVHNRFLLHAALPHDAMLKKYKAFVMLAGVLIHIHCMAWGYLLARQLLAVAADWTRSREMPSGSFLWPDPTLPTNDDAAVVNWHGHVSINASQIFQQTKIVSVEFETGPYPTRGRVDASTSLGVTQRVHPVIINLSRPTSTE